MVLPRMEVIHQKRVEARVEVEARMKGMLFYLFKATNKIQSNKNDLLFGNGDFSFDLNFFFFIS